MFFFLFFNILIQYTILYFNIFNINNIIKISYSIYLTILNNIFISNNNQINNKINNENYIIINNFIKNISLELTPILIILQQLDEISQLKQLKSLENKYPYITFIYPISKDDNIKEVINNYIFYMNKIYSEKI